MRKTKLQLVFLLLIVSGLANQLLAQTARLQVIHNSANAPAVDIYIDQQQVITSLAYREASGFQDADAGQTWIVIVPAGEERNAGVDSILADLQQDERYIVIASGLLDNTDTPFNLEVYEGGRETAQNEENVDILIFHGATDAPAVNISARNTGNLFPGASYGDFSDYAEAPAGFYVIDIATVDIPGDTVKTYGADLRTLAGSAITVLASGFLDPEANNGEEFTLLAVLADGTVVELPEAEEFEGMLSGLNEVPANPSPGNGSFRVILAGEVIQLYGDFNDLSTPYTGSHIHRAETGVNGGVMQGLVTTLDQEERSGEWVAAQNIFDISADDITLLREGGLYVNVHSQLLPPGELRGQILAAPNTAPNPGVITSPEDGAEITLEGSATTPFEPTWQEATDEDGDKVIYIWQLSPIADFDTILFTQSTGTDTRFSATFGAIDALLVAAGVEMGESITVYHRVVTSDGSHLTFGEPLSVTLTRGELTETALVQIIHNAADLAAESVDIYVNEVLLLPGFEFRTATPFVDIPANTELTVDIVPAGASLASSVGTFNVSFDENEAYVIVANGIVSETGYDPKIDFALYPYTPARTEALDPTYVDILIFHGATDAPTVSIWETSQMDNQLLTISYGEYSEYLSLEPGNYVIEIRTEDGETTVASFNANLQELAGESVTVLASGFLNPENNNQGPAFGLYAALAQGGDLIPLSITTSIPQVHASSANLRLYPNPVRDQLYIDLELKNSEKVTIELYNILGVQVRSLEPPTDTTILQIMDVSGLPQGTYILNIRSSNNLQSKRINIIK